MTEHTTDSKQDGKLTKPSSFLAEKLNLTELLEKRSILRKLKQSREDCTDIVKDDKEREKWSWFVFDSQSIIIPTDVMLQVIKDLGDCLGKEVDKIEQQFAEMNVDPDVD